MTASYTDSLDQKDNIVNKFDDSQRSQLAQTISKRFANATTEIQQLMTDSRDAWDYYLRNTPDTYKLANTVSVKNDTANTNRSRKGLRLGSIPKAVDTVVALIHNSIFPPDDRFFRGTPRNTVARRYQELYEQYRADNFAEDNTTEKLRRFLLSMCLDSAACIAVPWRQSKRKVTKWVSKELSIAGITIPLPMLGLKKVTKEEVVWEGTQVEALDFTDWRVDPFARNMDESWFIRRWYEPCWQVEKDYSIKKVSPYYYSYDMPDDVLGNQKRLSAGLVNPIPFDLEEEGKKKALLMVCYDDFNVNGKIYQNHCAVVLNGMELLWFGPNPYNHGRIPYIIHALSPVPNQIYGRSLVNHAIPSAAVIDTATDMTLQIGALAARPIFEVDMNEPVFKRSLEVKTGKSYPVKRVGYAIKQVPINITNLTSLETIIAKNEENIKEVTGTSSIISGEDFDQPANITAFQVQQHVQGAQSKFLALETNFNNSVVKELLTISFLNDQQFKVNDETLYVGDDEHELTVDMIRQMDFKWLITASNAARARGQRASNYQALLTMLPNLLQTGVVKLANEQVTVDVGYAMKQLAILGGEPDADLLIRVEQQQPPPIGATPNGLPPNGPPATGQLPPGAQGQPPIPMPQGPMPQQMPPQ